MRTRGRLPRTRTRTTTTTTTISTATTTTPGRITQDAAAHYHRSTHQPQLSTHHPRNHLEPANRESSVITHRTSSAHSHQWFRNPIPPYRHPSLRLSIPELRTTDPVLFPTHSHPSSLQPPQPPPSSHLTKQPIQYFPYSNSNQGPPKLSPSIASFHNAALVYLHRGLAIQSIQNQPSHPLSSSLPSSNPTMSIGHETYQEPFLSAVIKGFNKIVSLETGLEFSQPRQVMEALMSIVRHQLSCLSVSSAASEEESDRLWRDSKSVIIHSALRPRMACVGDWAWEEIGRGNFHRLVQVWTGILEIVDRKFANPTDPSTPTTVGLDERLFTALVVVSSTIQNGPSLDELVRSLVDRIWSRIHPIDHLDLHGLPDPDRARYFVRAVELGLMWRRPAEDEQQHSNLSVEQDDRIVHLIRRTFFAQNPQSLRSCVDISKRIQEAVNGHKMIPGWLAVDWSEPTGIATSDFHEPDEDNVPSTSAPKKREILLTQKVVGVLISGFAEHGLLEQVEELIRLSRRNGGMTQYLWSALLRGLTKQNKPGLVKEYVKRMEDEDKVEVDFSMKCILISASMSTDLDRALDSIDQLLLQSSSANANEPRSRRAKLPIEAVNSIISALLRHKLLERAETLLSQLSGRLTPNATTLNHFLNYHSRLQRPELGAVLEHLKQFESFSVKPDVVSFTVLLNILMKLGLGPGVVEKLLAMMEGMGIEPNAITYGSIIHHLCRSGKIEDVEVAHKLLEEIEQRGIATTDVTYTALIQGFLRAHIQEYESATQGVHVETGTLGTKSKLQRATELISKLKSRTSSLNANSSPSRGKLNQVIYNSLLNALFSTREFESGFQVFKLMKSEYDDHQPGAGLDLYGNGFIDTYGIIFRRLIQFGQFELFRTIYHEYFLNEKFTFIPYWIEKSIDRFEKSQL